MGNWAIIVQGGGVHHNTSPGKDGAPPSVLAADANILAAEFVNFLKEKGHTVSHAAFVCGSSDLITDADEYLSRYKPAGAVER